ncbi:MAG: LytR C-terminal domain-containing protein [Candidatus Cloacimonadales bacterium]
MILAILILALIIYIQKAFRAEIEEVPSEHLFDLSVKIAILNGNGYPNVATEVKEYFLDRHGDNIDVVGCRNVESRKFIYKQTLVIMKHDVPEKLEYIMKLTNIPFRIIALDDSAIEEIQIVLGKDYLEYFPNR